MSVTGHGSRKLLFFSWFAACTFLLSTGCSSTLESAPAVNKSQGVTGVDQVSQQEPQTMPWEIWPPFRDLNGHAVVNRELLLGDEHRRLGNRDLAMQAYQKAVLGALSPSEREAAIVRIASQHLYFDDEKQALTIIGKFFRDSGQTEASVSVPFGMVLAFAYGRSGDADQALAWFSKVFDMGSPGGPAQVASERGIAALLETLSESELDRLALDWHADMLVSRYVGAERMRRSSTLIERRTQESDEPFWKRTDGVALVPISPTDAETGSSHPPAAIGVVLGLSDKFASLGKDTQRGIEVAVAQAAEAGLTFVTEDAGADSSRASAAVRKLVAESNPKVILGPLLTESSVSAAETARDLGVPLISFAKSEGFTTGRGVYRLGATTSSQIDALVTAAYFSYGMKRFAIAYPNTGSGREYAHAFREKVNRLGLSVEIEVPYEATNDETLAEVALALEGTSATGLLIPDSIDVSARLIQNLSPMLRRQLRPLGIALWDNASKIARSQAVFEGGLFVSPFFSQSAREEVKQFVSLFKSKFGTTPNFLAAQGFDVASLVVAALKGESRADGTFEAMLLHAPPLNGATGVLSVTPSGEVVRTFYVVEVLKDSFQEVLPSERRTVAGMVDSPNDGLSAEYGAPVGEQASLAGNAARY